jgi:hypothetical protein
MFAMSLSMHRPVYTLLAVGLALALLASPLAAADPQVVPTGPLAAAGVPADVTAAVADHGYRVTLDSAWSADFWFVRALPTSSNAAAGALYPDLANGQFLAVVTFPKGSSDFRGQAIPAGTYTLRYQYIPQDANHMGVSPNPDFLLAIPVTADTNTADILPLKRLVALSAKSTGTAHPAVFAMAPAGSPASVAKDDQGMMIFTAEIPTASGKTEKIGIVVKGQATQ